MSGNMQYILSNLVRVGIVDGLNEKEGTVRVTFPDKDELVADDLAMLGFEQHYPDIGDSVLCLFLPNGIQSGFCLGKYYNSANPPPVPDRNLFVKKLDDGLTIRYDKRAKRLSIQALNEVTVDGDLRVTGRIRGGGDS